MLNSIAAILLIVWMLGMVSGYTLGNFIYALLAASLVLFLFGVITGRRVA